MGASQLAPGTRYTASEWRTNLTLSPTSEYSAQFRVIGGSTLEVTLCQFWSSLGAASLEIEVSFHGLQVDGALGGRAGGAPGCELSLSGAAGLGRFTLLSPLRRQRVKPEGKLSAVLAPLRPSESALEPLEKRPGGCGATQRES
ncbi:hypothetical protein MNEG_16007 [Monoraphidium neglectum]|uniref:Tripeptidyl-peptidase II galactose-binding domain-containing protein n=1 Tax=Monoraphidium neglectum TaxID=145388 RepID=A0A0D2LPP2_9CHLO|nr:hypothetical protein MNEG_16007 [Monoraphidium neglectum]KIY91956.1 hypothetical protein MNEG_16007 [Monoraphidium neglectum]|eukprot:XP_013890976.1 hypothetical protein MNEG_16007 [Monoraphidium neglectum]